jgi:hypothetical protein
VGVGAIRGRFVCRGATDGRQRPHEGHHRIGASPRVWVCVFIYALVLLWEYFLTNIPNCVVNVPREVACAFYLIYILCACMHGFQDVNGNIPSEHHILDLNALFGWHSALCAALPGLTSEDKHALKSYSTVPSWSPSVAAFIRFTAARATVHIMHGVQCAWGPVLVEQSQQHLRHAGQMQSIIAPTRTFVSNHRVCLPHTRTHTRNMCGSSISYDFTSISNICENEVSPPYLALPRL